MIKDWGTVDRCNVGTFYNLLIVFRKCSKTIICRRMWKNIVNVGPFTLSALRSNPKVGLLQEARTVLVMILSKGDTQNSKSVVYRSVVSGAIGFPNSER